MAGEGLDAVQEAIAFATAMKIHHAELAAGYREQYVSVNLAYIAGLAAAVGFWLNLPRLRRFVWIYCGLIGAAAFAMLAFQTHWTFYHFWDAEMAEEYEKHAMRLITTPGRRPFPTEPCDVKLDDDDVEWRTRKRREIEHAWKNTDEEVDPCCDVEFGTLDVVFGDNQSPLWIGVILATAAAAIGVVAATRHAEATGPDGSGAGRPQA